MVKEYESDIIIQKNHLFQLQEPINELLLRIKHLGFTLFMICVPKRK